MGLSCVLHANNGVRDPAGYEPRHDKPEPVLSTNP